MIKSKYLKNAILVTLIGSSLIACKKKKSTPVPEEQAVICFNTQNNGTYKGSGIKLSSPFTSGTLTVTRTSCQEVNLNLVTDSAGQVLGQVSQLTLNSNGNYDGKQSNGSNITLSFGSVLNVYAINSFTFTGTKQP
jgi:hypothetical protein